jgi:hypothetical protein
MVLAGRLRSIRVAALPHERMITNEARQGQPFEAGWASLAMVHDPRASQGHQTSAVPGNGARSRLNLWIRYWQHRKISLAGRACVCRNHRCARASRLDPANPADVVALMQIQPTAMRARPYPKWTSSYAPAVRGFGQRERAVETEITARSASPMPFPSLQTRHCPRNRTLLYRWIRDMSFRRVLLHRSLFR